MDPDRLVDFVQPDDVDKVLTDMAEDPRPNMVIPRGTTVSRRQVAEHFSQAFELIGGVPRLAMWASENPGDFYKLYAKLFPAASSGDLNPTPTFRIIHVLPRTPLDGE